MNVVKFGHFKKKKLVFCLVDRLNLCQDSFAREIIKNQTDYVISSIFSKRYNVYQGLNEDEILQSAALDDYEFAVVFSTGTEFVDGNVFFNSVNELIKNKFFICGHVLDRKDAYYELHHQCYIINLKLYKNLGMPVIGEQELGSTHLEKSPLRSDNNFHDDYTPTWVKPGNLLKEYKHKCHGWNILKVAFDNDLPVLVFDEKFRNSKKHHYPESRKDFIKHLPWIYYRDQECSTNFIHTANTEGPRYLKGKFEQVIIPASGTLYLDYIDVGSVIIYDYNEKSLEYWKKHLPRKENISYSFVMADLLRSNNLIDYILENKRTLINLTNIFSYEGTSALKPLYYRLYKENEIICNLQKKIPDIVISFSIRAATGFAEAPMIGDSRIIKPIDLKNLKKPTWHYNSDWL
jgi:hypothetical protein